MAVLNEFAYQTSLYRKLISFQIIVFFRENLMAEEVFFVPSIDWRRGVSPDIFVVNE
jgi:hypothetical protein